ncbi:hypothetical protein MIR68_006352 [Amoeboaphelidium protococcarum]|nr:hypothetical protein MIR68_006352 [Amoeboaphelidium protococcarum]
MRLSPAIVKLKALEAGVDYPYQGRWVWYLDNLSRPQRRVRGGADRS